MRSGECIDAVGTHTPIVKGYGCLEEAACADAPRPRLPREAPHCVTCFCLPSGKAKCRQPACSERCKEAEEKSRHRSSKLSLEGSGRRHITSVRKSGRKCTNAVDELLRELTIANGALSDDANDEFHSRQLCDRPSNEEAGNGGASPRQRRRRRGTGYHATERQHSRRGEARIRSCERWSPPGRRPGSRRTMQLQLQMVPAEDQSSDVSAEAKAAPSDAEPGYRPRDDWTVEQAARLFGTGDLDDRPPPPRDADKDSAGSEADDSAWSTQELGNSEAHVRELKLVRREVIERLYGEVRKLRRLQRHLDACSPRRPAPATRSECTMTPAELLNGDT